MKIDTKQEVERVLQMFMEHPGIWLAWLMMIWGADCSIAGGPRWRLRTLTRMLNRVASMIMMMYPLSEVISANLGKSALARLDEKVLKIQLELDERQRVQAFRELELLVKIIGDDLPRRSSITVDGLQIQIAASLERMIQQQRCGPEDAAPV